MIGHQTILVVEGEKLHKLVLFICHLEVRKLVFDRKFHGHLETNGHTITLTVRVYLYLPIICIK